MKASQIGEIALFALILWSFSASHANAALDKPTSATTNKGRVVSADIDVGNRGFLAIGWVELRERPKSEPLRVAFVRVQQPGDRRPRRAIRLGVATSGIDVEIGTSGLAVVVWSGSDGVPRYRHRRSHTGWSAAHPIGEIPVTSPQFSVGVDGTIIATRTTWENQDPATITMWVAVRTPGKMSFSPWRVVSAGAQVGLDSEVIATNDGRGTVAWSGLCSTNDSGNPAYYVDIDRETESPPIRLANSKCTVWNLDLQEDGRGRQYLMLGTWTGIRLAVRKPGSRFPKMTSITNSYKRGNGDLVVSQDGHMTLVWATSKVYLTSYRYVTMKNGSNLTKARPLMGPRMNVKQKRDYRLDSAALSGGKIFSLWSQIEPPEDGEVRWKHTFGTSTWLPGARFERPDYATPINPLLTPTPAMVDTAPDGSRLAWWIEESDRGEIKRVRYLYAK